LRSADGAGRHARLAGRLARPLARFPVERSDAAAVPAPCPADAARTRHVRRIRLALDPWPCDEIFTATPCSAGGDAAFGVRVVERFRTRQTPGVVFGDPSELVGPGLTTQVSDW